MDILVQYRKQLTPLADFSDFSIEVVFIMSNIVALFFDAGDYLRGAIERAHSIAKLNEYALSIAPSIKKIQSKIDHQI